MKEEVTPGFYTLGTGQPTVEAKPRVTGAARPAHRCTPELYLGASPPLLNSIPSPTSHVRCLESLHKSVSGPKRREPATCSAPLGTSAVWGEVSRKGNLALSTVAHKAFVPPWEGSTPGVCEHSFDLGEY